MSAATNALCCAQACENAKRLVAQIQAGDALPDALHVALQDLRAAADGAGLRAFTRAVQKALERSTAARGM